jgi:BirA family biotin operon repressor/biotin-[acetyl-CoA-carboxylase] ligase
MDDGLERLFNRRDGKASLGTRYIGRKVLVYDWVTSTNDLAHWLAQNDEPEGTVVFARGQTQGRGRLGKDWVSPFGQGLYFSFILRPGIQAEDAARITLTVSWGIAAALGELHVPGVNIKWPNDILVNGKKICGILTEMHLEGAEIGYVVVGVGLNVNTAIGELPPGSTSLKQETKGSFDLADLSHIILKKIDGAYETLLRHRFADIMAGVKEFSGLILGGRVRVTWEGNEVQGYAVDFDEHGRLIIRRDNGLLEKVASGHLEIVS